MNVDGGKNLTIRGQHTWYGMNEDQTRGFEVGESTSVIDFFKTKLRGRINTNGKIVNSSNPDVNQFVEQNSTSLWGKKDQNMHINYAYQKPEDKEKQGAF